MHCPNCRELPDRHDTISGIPRQFIHDDEMESALSHEPKPQERESYRFKVGVFGHYGNENLGDESIIEATIANIRERQPDTEVVCFSLNPPDTEMRYGVRTHPVILTDEYTSRRSEMTHEQANSDVPVPEPGTPVEHTGLRSLIKRIPIIYPLLRSIVNLPGALSDIWQELKFLHASRRHLLGMDLLVFAGSNQFLDNFGGVWGFPYNVLKWTLLARISGVKVAFVSVGAGPLFARTSRAMIRIAVSMADYVSYRDESSRQLIDADKSRGRHVCPDLAFSLPIEVERESLRDPPVIGINAMAVFHSKYWFIKDQDRYRQYVSQLKDIALFAREHGYGFFLFANQPRDEAVIDDVLDLLAAEGIDRQSLDANVRRSTSLAEYIHNLFDADVIVATRFHGTVLALLAERPVLGLCYYWKAARLLEDMGQADYALDLDSLSSADIKNRLSDLIGKRREVVAQIRERKQTYADMLDSQYDDVLHLIR
jgi:polysaccharide pyruvyl transferase WcaK-like protein